MAVPWMRVLDGLLGLTDVARRVTAGRAGSAGDARDALAPGAAGVGALETRLAGVVVAALKEAFDRDSHRLELERQQVEAERERAERALRLELLRQAGDREIGRLRLLAGVAVASWMGTLFFSTRLLGAGVAGRVLLGGGWALLLAALAASFMAQTTVTGAIGRLTELSRGDDRLDRGTAGLLAPWFIVFGLALVGLAVLVA